MTSTSSEGASTIALTFTDKANADLIATTVERQVNSVIQSLPADAQRPTVTKIDLSALPVMQLAVVSDTLPGTDLFTIADQTLTPEFQKVNGVSQVALIGGQKQEIQVAIDPFKLAGLRPLADPGPDRAGDRQPVVAGGHAGKRHARLQPARQLTRDPAGGSGHDRRGRHG